MRFFLRVVERNLRHQQDVERGILARIYRFGISQTLSSALVQRATASLGRHFSFNVRADGVQLANKVAE